MIHISIHLLLVLSLAISFCEADSFDQFLVYDFNKSYDASTCQGKQAHSFSVRVKGITPSVLVFDPSTEELGCGVTLSNTNCAWLSPDCGTNVNQPFIVSMGEEERFLVGVRDTNGIDLVTKYTDLPYPLMEEFHYDLSFTFSLVGKPRLSIERTSTDGNSTIVYDRETDSTMPTPEQLYVIVEGKCGFNLITSRVTCFN